MEYLKTFVVPDQFTADTRRAIELSKQEQIESDFLLAQKMADELTPISLPTTTTLPTLPPATPPSETDKDADEMARVLELSKKEKEHMDALQGLQKFLQTAWPGQFDSLREAAIWIVQYGGFAAGPYDTEFREFLQSFADSDYV